MCPYIIYYLTKFFRLPVGTNAVPVVSRHESVFPMLHVAGRTSGWLRDIPFRTTSLSRLRCVPITIRGYVLSIIHVISVVDFKEATWWLFPLNFFLSLFDELVYLASGVVFEENIIFTPIYLQVPITCNTLSLLHIISIRPPCEHYY